MKSQSVLKAALLASLLAASGLQAAEVAGVHLQDKLRLAGQELVLNGAGIRSKFFVKVYVAGLYAPQRSTSVGTLLEATSPRRMSLHLLREVGADSFYGALEEGLANNLSAAELAAIKPQVDQFATLMKGVGKVREGDVVALDFTADGVAVALNGSQLGLVAGGPFAKALLKVWLGEKPADEALKKALLGG